MISYMEHNPYYKKAIEFLRKGNSKACPSARTRSTGTTFG